MKYSGAEIVIKLLEKQNVEYIIGIPGGFNLPIYDALYFSHIKHILARHEQGAGFIAQGISRTSNKVGVCMATSGPGVTNLLTAIADAKLDSIPLVAITGQVPLSSIGTDAFQEVDTYGLTIPITKHNFLVRKIEDLFTIIPEAFRLASEGRPGPVLVDIPKDIQTGIIDIDNFDLCLYKYKEEYHTDLNLNLKEIAKMINSSKRPIIYAGGGIINSNSSKLLYDFSKKNTIPVALSLMGISAFPSDDDLYLGMVGMHGAPYTNYLFNEADLIIALGVRFDDRATGSIASFCPNANVIHVDIDPSEINKIKHSNISLVSNVYNFLQAIIKETERNDRLEWINRIKQYKEKYPLPHYNNKLHPANLIPFIANNIPSDTIITTDVGEHQMWVAQRYPFKTPKTFITSGGLGTMGFGLPTAIGAALENPNKTILCFSGDGSILMNIQELATLKDYNLNIKVIILNNHHLGLVRQQQELFYNKHYIASKFISNPQFNTIAEGFGIKGYNLLNENSLDSLIDILNSPNPSIINVPIKDTEMILPMVSPGGSNIDMIGGVINE